jgi:hypothetical protein
MANADRPRGFVCKGKPLRVTAYESGSACYPGDFVALATDGQVDPVAAGGNILGLCMSYASAAGQVILVADDPDQQFIGQCDASAVDAQTDIGNVCDIKATAGNSTYKASRHEVDDATLTAAGSAQLQVLGVEPKPDNALGANVSVYVRINEHQFSNASSGV